MGCRANGPGESQHTENNNNDESTENIREKIPLAGHLVGCGSPRLSIPTHTRTATIIRHTSLSFSSTHHDPVASNKERE